MFILEGTNSNELISKINFEWLPGMYFEELPGVLETLGLR